MSKNGILNVRVEVMLLSVRQKFSDNYPLRTECKAGADSGANGASAPPQICPPVLSTTPRFRNSMRRKILGNILSQNVEDHLNTSLLVGRIPRALDWGSWNQRHIESTLQDWAAANQGTWWREVRFTLRNTKKEKKWRQKKKKKKEKKKKLALWTLGRNWYHELSQRAKIWWKENQILHFFHLFRQSPPKIFKFKMQPLHSPSHHEHHTTVLLTLHPTRWCRFYCDRISW